jgi:hypothetical protein
MDGVELVIIPPPVTVVFDKGFVEIVVLESIT